METREAQAQMPFAVGDLVDGKYQIEAPPKMGGYAFVYQAREMSVDRIVALKVLKDTGQDVWDHLIRESASQAKVQHSNVLPVYTVGRDQERNIPYIVLKWVEGSQTLWDRYSRPTAEGDLEECLEIAIQIAGGLQAIHRHGKLHGDISPRNILIENENGRIRPLLGDFGLSHEMLDGSWGGRGTLPYLAPEQFDSGQFDERSEIHSLGAIFFELFTDGSYYLSADRYAENIREEICRYHHVRSLFEVTHAHKGSLDRLIRRMLEKAPEDRPQSVDEVIQELNRIREQYRTGRESLNGGLEDQDYGDAIPYMALDLNLSEHIRSALLLQKIQELCDQNTVYDCYLYNRGLEADGTLRFLISLAADSENMANRKVVRWAREKDTGHQALTLDCETSRGNRSVYVRRVEYDDLLCFRSIHCFPVRITFGKGSSHGLPEEIKRGILSQVTDPRDVEVERRLAHWQGYLSAWEKMVEKQEAKFIYSDFHRDAENNRWIWFSIENDESDDELFLESRSERVQLVEGDPDATLDSRATTPTEIGTFSDFRLEEPRQIKVELYERYAPYDPAGVEIPLRGYLKLSRRGDRAQISQQRQAMERLKQGVTANPRLRQFIFDAGQAALPDPEEAPIILKREDLLSDPARINAQQLRAIEGALNAPDLYLIQGPPGTGKTTVIAELCYQFASRGMKVLVVSQTHLAVDNVLSRLLHHPRVIPFRFGDFQKVEKEGVDYTEQYVVDRWFERTASICEEQSGLRKAQTEGFLTFDAEFLNAYLQKRFQAESRLPELCEQAARYTSAASLAETRAAGLTKSLAALAHLMELFEKTKTLLQTGRTFENRTSDWGMEEYNFRLDPDYQAFLETFLASSRALDKLGLNDPPPAKMMPPGLELDALQIEHLSQDDPKAGEWHHNVPAMLVAGKILFLRLRKNERVVRAFLQDAWQLDGLLERSAELFREQERLKPVHQDAVLLVRILQDTQAGDRVVAACQDLAWREEQAKEIRSRVDAIAGEIQALNAEVTETSRFLANWPDVVDQVRSVQGSLGVLANQRYATWQSLYGCHKTVQQYEEVKRNLESRTALRAQVQANLQIYRSLLENRRSLDRQINDWFGMYVHRQRDDSIQYDIDALGLPARLKQEVEDFYRRTGKADRPNISRLRQVAESELKSKEEQLKVLEREILPLQARMTSMEPNYPAAKKNYQEELESIRLLLFSILESIRKLNELTGMQFCSELSTLETTDWDRPDPTYLTDMIVREHAALQVEAGELKTLFTGRKQKLEEDRQKLLHAQARYEACQNELLAKSQEAADAQQVVQEGLSQLDLKNPVFKPLMHAISSHVPVEDTQALWARTKKSLYNLVEIKRANILTALEAPTEEELPDADLPVLLENRLQQAVQARLLARQEIVELVDRLQLEQDLDTQAIELRAEVRDLIRIFSNTFLEEDAVRPETALARAETAVGRQMAGLHERLVQEQAALSTGLAGASECEQEIAAIETGLVPYRDRWQKMHGSIPKHLVAGLNMADIHSSAYLEQILTLARDPSWKQEQLRRRDLLEPAQQLASGWIARLREKRPEDIDHLKGLYFRNANVIGVTCGQVNRLDKFQNNASPFDAVIVDEVSKATPPELFMPILKGRRIVLVGDHKQLPPLVKNQSLVDVSEELDVPLAQVEHLRRSMFGGLYESAPEDLRCMLTEQFRMRRPIMQAINQFYGEQLQGGHDRAHLLPVGGIRSDQCIAWIDTPANSRDYREEIQGHSSYNPGEIRIIEKLLEQMNAAWMPHFKSTGQRKEIGVITFYLAQRRRISERVNRKKLEALDVRIGTVDRFQGMERQVVIVSLVRNNTRGDIGFAEVPERINVAFSRAQELLIVLGCKSLFTTNFLRAGKAKEYYRRIAEIIHQEGAELDAAQFLKS